MSLLHGLDGQELDFAEQIFAGIPMGLLILDESMGVVGCNGWLLARLPAEMARRTEEKPALLELFPELQGSRLAFAVQQALEMGQPAFLSNSLNPHPLPLYEGGDRSTERLNQTVHIIPLHGNMARFCLIQVQDVSHAVQREKLLAKKAALARDKELELEQALQVAYEASRAKSRFLAHMSHDIRTPLVSLLGFTEYLLDSELNADQRTHLEIIRKSGDNLLYLLSDILDFARIEAGKIQIHQESVSLEEVIKEALAPFLSLAAQKLIDLEYDIAPDLPEFVETDPNRLKQVFHNLISNAIKFTERGHVLIYAENSNSGVRFIIEDTGMGVAEDKQELVFESFAQQDESRSRRFEGTGLGLSIVRSLVEMMEGTVQIQSPIFQEGEREGGPGSRFIVTLPLKEGSPGIVGSRPQPAALDFSGKRILLAEDNPDNTLLFDRLFQRMGLRYEHAGNGERAVELARNNPDLILMDIQMPIMDGYEATRRIRNNGYKGPIVALTANAYKEDRDMAMEAGMNDYLAKPVGRRPLEQMLARWILSGVHT